MPQKNSINHFWFLLVELFFMEWKKAPAELVDFIMEKMKDRNCDYKKMFGYPAYFLNGNMFVGVHGDKLFLRLSDADTGGNNEGLQRRICF